VTQQHQQILEYYSKLRPREHTKFKISNLNKDQKYDLAKEARVWGYLNALSREFAKDLSINLDDNSTLLGGAILIHMSIFDYDEDTTKRIYNEMHKDLKLSICKDLFASAAKDAQKDMLDFRNNIKLMEETNFPRFDIFIYGYVEKFNL